MIYFTSDLHLWLNHDKEFVWKDRGFNSVEEMNNIIINNYNSIVNNDDIVYILGDCCMGVLEISVPLLAQLKGHKYLIIGNHDTERKIEEYKKYNIFESIEYGGRIKYKKKMFIFSHYPMLVGNASNEKTWNLHGHTHQKHCFGTVPQCYHVGIDSHNCFPVLLDKIYEEINNNVEN